jgi:hypothetical protein
MAGQKGKRLNMLQALPIRGGNWNNAASAGVFNLNCNNTRTNSNTNIGARPDSIPLALHYADGGLKGGVFLHSAQAFAKSAGHPFSSSCHVAVERLGVFL